MSFVIETRSLTKKFGSFAAITNLDFKIRESTIHAVIGENGAGKTTLLKLLFGLHAPTAGEIYLKGEKKRWKSPMDAISNGLGMVQQHFTLVEELTAIDNIMLGMEETNKLGVLDRAAAIERMERLLPSEALKVPWNDLVENLSVGHKQRVEILKLLYRDAKILFLDEPTAVLAPQEIDDFFEVLRGLKKQGRTIVLITHKLNEVKSLCDDFTVLRAGIKTGEGSVATTSSDQMIEMMIGRKLKPKQLEEKIKSEELVIECRNLSDEGQERGALKDVSLNVKKGEIVGIAGLEGSGQAGLVQTLMSVRKSKNGEFFFQGKKTCKTKDVRDAGVALVPEDRIHQGLWPEASCYHNLMIGLEPLFFEKSLLKHKKMKSLGDSWSQNMDVRAASLEVSAGSLSGGNQQKLILAREIIGRKAKILICHHPTRGVDLGAIEHIHDTLKKLRLDGAGILLISSELEELMSLCDRMYVMFEGQVLLELQRSEFDIQRIGRAMVGLKQEAII